MRILAAFVIGVILAPLPAAASGADALAAQLAPCLACHGKNGQSTTAEVPSLGGQPAYYLTIQLYMFREKLRVVEVMNKATRGLADDDLNKIAEAIAKLPPPRPAGGSSDSADAGRMERARTLAEQNRCNFCHNANYSGEQNVPRLAGQREDYLMKALREYKDNRRRGYDAAMADVLYAIGDEQIRDLAYFLARAR